MTEERNTKDTAVEPDAVVTQAYRGTADEHAPDSLNRAILDQAAKAARPRYFRLILWTRPMAWAATVMLSVAIVLQLTQVPAPESARFGDSIHEVEAPADIPTEQLEEAVLPVSAPKIEALRSSAKQVAPGALSEARQRAEQSKATVVDQETAAPEQDSARFVSDEFELKDQDMLQRADDMARMREGDNRQAAPASELPQSASADVATLGAARAFVMPQGCDESYMATPETWLKCITVLEEAGQSDAAREERKLLAAAFPDSDPP